MLKTKKFFSLILSFVLCVIPFCSMAHAESPENNIGLFIGQIVPSYKEQFVFDGANRDRLTAELGKRLPRGASLLEYRRLYNDAVQSLLENDEEVRYNCRALSEWVWYELHSHLPVVECKELTIASRKDNGDIGFHAAVLIPYNDQGTKKWFVCDLSYMSQYHDFRFAFAELKDYISAHKNLFMGMIVNNDEYTSWDVLTGIGKRGGRDIAAWLATDAGDTDSALEILRSQGTPKIKVMSSADILDGDKSTIERLISLSLELKAKSNNNGIDFIRV